MPSADIRAVGMSINPVTPKSEAADGRAVATKAKPKSKVALLSSPNLNSDKNLNPSVKNHRSMFIIIKDGTNFLIFELK